MPLSNTLKTNLIGIALIALLSLLVHAQSADDGFFPTDDHRYLHGNSLVKKGLTPENFRAAFTEVQLFDNWHPLTTLSLMLDVSLFGMNPEMMHWGNTLWHTLASILVFLIGMRLRLATRGALLAAALFAVHPLHAESVAWLSERKDVLCALFYLATVYVYLGYARQPSGPGYVLVVLFALLASLSKPMSVTLPVALLLIDWLLLNRLPLNCIGRLLRQPVSFLKSYGWLLVEKLPMIGFAGFVSAVTLLAQQHTRLSTEKMGLWLQVANPVLSYAVYLRDLVYPVDLTIFYPLLPIDPWTQFLPAVTVLAVLAGISIRLAMRGKTIFLFAFLWYLVTLIPVVGLVQVGAQSHADRYMYLPSVGPLLALGWLVGTVPSQFRTLANIMLALTIGFFAFMGWIQVRYWDNPVVMFQRNLELQPKSWHAHMVLSNIYLNLRDFDKATEHAQALIQIQPRLFPGYLAMASIRMAQHDYPGAESNFAIAHQLEPSNVVVLNAYGRAKLRLGKPAEAAALFRKALAIDPRNDYTIRNLRAAESRLP